MNIKHSILIASFFLSADNVYTMESTKAVSSAEEMDESIEKKPFFIEISAPMRAYAKICVQQIAKQITHFIPPQALANIISEYALLMPSTLVRATMRLEKGLKDNAPTTVINALNTFADANGISSANYSYLMHSIDINLCPEIIEALLVHGANPNPPRDYYGKSLLHKAYDPRIIQLLVQHKADIHATDNDGNTALHHAVITIYGASTAKTIRCLVDAGANPYTRNNKGQSALDIAKIYDAREKENTITNAIMEAFNRKHESEQ